MEKVMKKDEKNSLKGFIVTVYFPDVPGASPSQSFIDTPSDLAETVARILGNNPRSVILVQASVNL
jgi:hypothetical protein